jgi:dihydrofolate synthase / folylpolyglutamate synthase
VTDPLDFLFSLERLGMKFGLENMRALCAALGHPEAHFAPVIIGGTNGKGSVTAMTSAALHAAGHRVGRYTSPHLQRIEERFVLFEREVETADLRDAAATVRGAVERLVGDGTLGGPPTFFECATAIAFELFRRHTVAIAVLEVGLGGRLDATNVVSPIAASITSIDFDHQAQLGHDLSSIAFEKAGIIKPGIPVVCGPLPPEADAVIVEACRTRGATLIRAGADVEVDMTTVDDRQAVDLRTSAHTLKGLHLALEGRHQIDNAAVAMRLLETVGDRGFPVSAEAIRRGLTAAHWPARLEHLTWHGASVLLDAAHNPAGARALASYLRDRAWQGSTLLVAVVRDKDVDGILAPLLPLMGRVICTTADSPRGMAAAELADAVRRLRPAGPAIEAIRDPRAAAEAACVPGARVVVAGSIFLVGPLRGILR